MRYFLILNPGSRGGNSRKKFNKIFELMRKHKMYYDYGITTCLDDAYTFSVQANKEGYDVIVAVGGDGTINRVINGFYDEKGQRISKSKFGVIYTGTSPDFCKSYNIPTKIDKAVSLLHRGNSQAILIGKIVHVAYFHKKFDGQSIDAVKDKLMTSYFACCANVGIGPALARNANSGIRKRIGDFGGTFVSLIKTLTAYQPCDFIVCTDGIVQKVEKVFNLSIGRTYYIASGIKVKHQLKKDDDLFYNFLVKNLSIKNWVGTFIKIYSGKRIINNDIFSLEYTKTIEVYGNSQNAQLEFDGDPRGFLPCRIEMAKDSLELICEV